MEAILCKADREQTDRLAWQEAGYNGGNCHIILRVSLEDGKCEVITRDPSQNAVPMSEWHGVDQKFWLPNNSDAVAFVPYFDKALKPRLDAFLAASSVYQDANMNWKGRINEDFYYEVEQLVEYAPELPDGYGLWDADDWYMHYGWRDLFDEYGDRYSLNPDDDDFDDMVEEMEKAARAQGAVVYDVGYMAKCLCELMRDHNQEVTDGV